jgi:hypothetical protein
MRCSFEDGGERGPRLEFGRLRMGVSYQVRMRNAIGGLWKDVQKRGKIFNTEGTE